MEQWKPIPGYEGLYEASELGRIRTADGKTTSNERYEKRVWKQRILKQKFQRRKSNGKYVARVSLWKDGSEKTWLVARLVALAWCDGFYDGMTVNHKNGDTLNNKPENLEWVTIEENIKHGFDNVLFSSQKPCLLIDEKGNRKWYRSQCDASRGIGRHSGYIWDCIKFNRPIKSSDGKMFSIIQNSMEVT